MSVAVTAATESEVAVALDAPHAYSLQSAAVNRR